MNRKPPKTDGGGERKPKQTATREDRLKAALKANLARRKQQARARKSAGDQG